jgi:hypothetical protein
MNQSEEKTLVTSSVAARRRHPPWANCFVDLSREGRGLNTEGRTYEQATPLRETENWVPFAQHRRS